VADRDRDTRSDASLERYSLTSGVAGFMTAVGSLLGVFVNAFANASFLGLLASPTGIALVLATLALAIIVFVLFKVIRRRRKYFASFTFADIDDNNLRDMVRTIEVDMAEFAAELSGKQGGDAR